MTAQRVRLDRTGAVRRLAPAADDRHWLRLPENLAWLVHERIEPHIPVFDKSSRNETAVERLRHASGRSVIAAASAAAYEGYNGHGLLTWAIRDAFTQHDGTSGDFVELLPLAAHRPRGSSDQSEGAAAAS